jgi:hypothetical protein
VTVDAIKRDDLIAFHKEYFQPENVSLAVFGDFDAAEMKAKVEKTFGSWAKGGRPKPAVPPVGNEGGKPGLYVINKEDLTQSTLGIAFPLGRMDDPDYPSLVVMTSVLGGGFGSRMMNQIRSVEGLAYMAYAHYPAAYDRPGYWFAAVGTKSETTARALELMKREIAGMKTAEVKDEELARAKDNILKGEAFDFDSTGKIVGRLMAYDYYGYPADFLKRYRAGIDAVTKADVLRVAKKYLDESKFQILVLGKQSEFATELAKFGTPVPIDITIPQPKREAAPAATAETTDKGKALLTKARAAHGGAALEKINDHSEKSTMKMQTPQGEMELAAESTATLSGKAVIKIVTPNGPFTQGYDGKSGWFTPPGAPAQDAPSQMLDQFKANTLRDTLRLLKEFDKGSYEVQSLGAAKFEGKDVEAITVKVPAEKLEFKVYVDPATGLVAGNSYFGSIGGPPAEVQEIFSDYHAVDGIQRPRKIVVMSGGQKRAEVTTSETRFNTNPPDSMFSKP